MYKFPLRIPDGLRLSVVQSFYSYGPVDAARALSIPTPPEHLGVDVTCGDGPQTYGLPCVWPFPFPGTVYSAEVDAPEGATLHAHAQVDGVDPATGIEYSLVYLHLSAVVRPRDPTDLHAPTITYQQGEVVGYVGNNGYVNPEPTPAHPFDGSHLHLGVGVKKPGELNGTMVDPLTLLDVNDPFRGPDDPSRDQPVYDWAARQYVFTRDLALGMANGDVAHLQARLGVSPQSGYFGPLTKAAVVAYQKANGILPSGYLGPITRARLNTH